MTSKLQEIMEKYRITTAKEQVGDRFSLLVQGPGGTGKSTLLGSMCEMGKTLLIATLPREIESWKYQQYNPDVFRCWDEDPWVSVDKEGSLPRNIRVEAFDKFVELTEALREDDTYDVVLLDNGTELAEAAWHKAMLPHSVIAPAYIADKKSRWTPYETLGINLDQAIKNLVNLTNAEFARRPKYVGISWHVQPPKDDQVEYVDVGGNVKQRVEKTSADHAGEGLEYEGKVLPMIRGNYRRKLVSQVSAVVFTDLQHTTERVEDGVRGTKTVKSVRYRIQVRPDAERHAKISGPMASVQFIDNNFKALLKLVEAGRQEPMTVTEQQTAEERPKSRLRAK